LDCIEDRELADTYRTQQNKRSGRRANREQPSLSGLFGEAPARKHVVSANIELEIDAYELTDFSHSIGRA